MSKAALLCSAVPRLTFRTPFLAGGVALATLLATEVLAQPAASIPDFSSNEVAWQQGNGGDISIQAPTLVMQTGFIQANTAAANASGGKVNIDVDALVPSGSTLFVGGATPFTFAPGVFGFNVIQAAAPTGVTATAGNGSATVNWSAPSSGGSPITSYAVTPYVGTAAQAPISVSGSPPRSALMCCAARVRVRAWSATDG